MSKLTAQLCSISKCYSKTYRNADRLPFACSMWVIAIPLKGISVLLSHICLWEASWCISNTVSSVMLRSGEISPVVKWQRLMSLFFTLGWFYHLYTALHFLTIRRWMSLIWLPNFLYRHSLMICHIRYRNQGSSLSPFANNVKAFFWRAKLYYSTKDQFSVETRQNYNSLN